MGICWQFKWDMTSTHYSAFYPWSKKSITYHFLIAALQADCRCRPLLLYCCCFVLCIWLSPALQKNSRRQRQYQGRTNHRLKRSRRGEIAKQQIVQGNTYLFSPVKSSSWGSSNVSHLLTNDWQWWSRARSAECVASEKKQWWLTDTFTRIFH